jgi:type IV pilus assembly protein PilV
VATARENRVSRTASLRGFTLLEVMVALVVLAIGVMGVIGLQTSTYKQLQTSNNFSKASMLASDMADRMLANQENVPATAYVHTVPPEEKPEPDCALEDCTAAELAAYDVWRWQTELLGKDPDDETKIPGSLPNATGEVATNADAEFIILVRWDDDMSGSTGTACAARDPAEEQDADDLECYVLNLGCLDALGALCP